MPNRGHPGVAAALVLIASACAYPEYERALEARGEYEACVVEHSATHPDCEVLWAAYQTELERYDEAARRGWSCDPKQDECPTKR